MQRTVILTLGIVCVVVLHTASPAQDPPTEARADDPAKKSVIPFRPLQKRTIAEAPPPDNWRYEAFQWYIGMCAFIIGACVGSFLNVVIYRLPLGMGLLRADSHCPVCKMPIAFKDNVPILAWFKLRGRCRECAARISPRYMVVELTTALLFLYLAVVELFSGGANLPGNAFVDVSVSPLAALDGELIGIYLTHCFAASALVCCVLIAGDGHAIPRSLTIPTILVGLFSPFRVASQSPLLAEGPGAGFLHAVLGLVVGGLLGGLLGLGERYDAQGKKRQLNLAIVTAVIGCYFGWDVSLFAVSITAAVMVVASVSGKRPAGMLRFPAVAIPAIVVFALIPIWRGVESAWWWPHPLRFPASAVAAILGLGVVGLGVRNLRSRDNGIKRGSPHSG